MSVKKMYIDKNILLKDFKSLNYKSFINKYKKVDIFIGDSDLIDIIYEIIETNDENKVQSIINKFNLKK